MILSIIQYITILVPVLLSVAYLTLIERKVIGGMQRRVGPNRVGIFGILQPLADGLKLVIKETIIPNNANIILFLIAPSITFILAILGWMVIPFNKGVLISDMNLGILYLLMISSLSVYGIIISGWSSNSKYAFLGALRSTAQMISYELALGMIILNVILITGSFNLTQIVLNQSYCWYFIPLFPLFILAFISAVAETNRHPFDLPEAEAELVSGYNIEYSAVGFALFFIAEYSNMILMSGLLSILFLAGWLSPIAFIAYGPWLIIKISFFLFVFIWIRATLPRYRYDQLMSLGWKVFLPFTLAFFLFSFNLFFSFDWLP